MLRKRNNKEPKFVNSMKKLGLDPYPRAAEAKQNYEAVVRNLENNNE